MASKNNRIIIKPGRTHACVCCLLGHTSELTSHQLRVYSMVDDLPKRREEDDARQNVTIYVCVCIYMLMYVCMAVIKLSLDTQLQAVVIGLKSADRE